MIVRSGKGNEPGEEESVGRVDSGDSDEDAGVPGAGSVSGQDDDVACKEGSISTEGRG